MIKRISAHAIQALKEALCNIYWYKSDLRSFLQNCITDTSSIASANWGNYKRQIVSDIVDKLCSDQEKYLGDLRRLFHEVSEMKSFHHLEQLEDGKIKSERARQSVAELKRIVEVHDEVTREQEDIEQRRKIEAERLRKNQAVREKLEEVKNKFTTLLSSTQPHKQGFDLEAILYDLF